MTRHETGTREQWLAARRELLGAEKAHTRAADDLARRRRELPWVRVEQEYVFDTLDGEASLRELFGGRSQLLVYHFMFPGCPSCATMADGFDGSVVHWENHDVAFAAVCRSPLTELNALRERMGWRFRFVSSARSDFNYDFGVSFTDQQLRDGPVYNFTKLAPMTPGEAPNDFPGMSAFAIQDDAVHHTYSSFGRGGDALWGMYPWLDRAPLGRNETPGWFRHRDEYDA